MTDLPEKPKDPHRAQFSWSERGGQVDLQGFGGLLLGAVVVIAVLIFVAYMGFPLIIGRRTLFP